MCKAICNFCYRIKNVLKTSTVKVEKNPPNNLIKFSTALHLPLCRVQIENPYKSTQVMKMLAFKVTLALNFHHHVRQVL